MRSWASRVVLGVLALSAVLIAQTPPPQPTFRSGIQTIEVDVLVTDQKGKFVRGLTKDDFTLTEDGTSQSLTQFRFVELPIEPPAARAAAAKEMPSDIATNMGEGRMYVMLMSGPAEGLRSRLIVRRFVEEALGPNDQMAVIHVRGNASAAQGFTRNRGLLLAAIDRMQYETGDDAGGCRDAVCEFEVLEELSERLGLVTGRRKVVLWFDPPSVFIPRGDARAQAAMLAQRDALRAATRNNVAVYPVSTQGLTTALGLGRLEYKAGLRVLSDETGGETIVETNNWTPMYQWFVRDNSMYYLLAYDPAVEHRDGEFHKISVRVKNRPELIVRARTGYYAPEPDAKAKPRPAVVEGLSAATADAVRMPSSVGDLGIDLFVAPFKGDGLTGSVVLGAQLRGADLLLAGAHPIEVAFQGTTTEGAITPGAFKTFALDYLPASRLDIERRGLRVVDRIALPKGRHQVRFAVHQPSGKTGSVVADVEVPDFKAALTMSGVVFASALTAQDRSLMSDDRLKAVLGSDPTAVRRFARRDVITAFAEVYTNPERPDVARVTARATPVKGGRARVPEISPTPGEPGRMGYVMRLRLADFSPGEYVLRVEAANPRDTVTRQVPFTVTGD